MKKLFTSILLILLFAVSPQASTLYIGDDNITGLQVGCDAGVQISSLGLFPYVFYATFGSGKDKVSGQDMLTVLSAGRFDAEGNSYGENIPVIDGDGLNGYGAFEQLARATKNLFSTAWFGFSVDTDSDGKSFTATAARGGIMQFGAHPPGIYTVSFDAYIEQGGQTGNYDIIRYGTAESDLELPLTEIPTRYQTRCTIIEADAAFGIVDKNSSNWAKIYATNFQFTKTPYEMPYAPNPGLYTTLVVPNNNADADEGNKWPMADMPLLQTALTGQGQMDIIDWEPQFDFDQTSGQGNIITCNDSTPGMLSHDDDGTIVFSDGTGTISVDVDYQAGTKYKISAMWGNHPDDGVNKMQIIVTDGITTWESLIVDFDESFNPGDFLSLGWENENWWKEKKIIVHKLPQAWGVYTTAVTMGGEGVTMGGESVTMGG